MIVNKLACISFENMTFSKKINYLIRKYDFLFYNTNVPMIIFWGYGNLIFRSSYELIPRKLIVCFEEHFWKYQRFPRKLFASHSFMFPPPIYYLIPPNPHGGRSYHSFRASRVKGHIYTHHVWDVPMLHAIHMYSNLIEPVLRHTSSGSQAKPIPSLDQVRDFSISFRLCKGRRVGRSP